MDENNYQDQSEIETETDQPEENVVYGDDGSDEQQYDQDREKPESRFKEGEILRFVRVRFPGNAKSFPFYVGKKTFAYGERVVALSDRGMAVGYVNSFPYERPFEESMMPIYHISKTATDEDMVREKELINKEKSAEIICKKLIEKHNLDMNLTHVEFTQYGKKSVFYFTSPNRVYFRGLVKDLVSELKMRIELRQISLRDRAAAIGGIGPCGREFCCSSFLKKYGQVSIKMAKNQSLALSGNKINGACDQLKCCLQYEDRVYADKRKVLPKEGSFIRTLCGDTGKVLNVHVLAEEFDLLTDQGFKRRYRASEFSADNPLPLSWAFPSRFENIIDETANVIGAVVSAPHSSSAAEDEESNYVSPSAEATTEQEVENVTREDNIGQAEGSDNDHDDQQESEETPSETETSAEQNASPENQRNRNDNHNSDKKHHNKHRHHFNANSGNDNNRRDKHHHGGRPHFKNKNRHNNNKKPNGNS